MWRYLFKDRDSSDLYFSRTLSIRSLQLRPVNSTGFSGVEKWLLSFAAIRSQSDDFSGLAASTSIARSMSFWTNGHLNGAIVYKTKINMNSNYVCLHLNLTEAWLWTAILFEGIIYWLNVSQISSYRCSFSGSKNHSWLGSHVARNWKKRLRFTTSLQLTNCTSALKPYWMKITDVYQLSYTPLTRNVSK